MNDDFRTVLQSVNLCSRNKNHVIVASVSTSSAPFAVESSKSRRTAGLSFAFTAPYTLSSISVCLCDETSSVFSEGLGEWQGRQFPAEQVVQPKRLLQQIHSQEELLHNHLNTRVKNDTAGLQVSVACTCAWPYTPILLTIRADHKCIIIHFSSILVSSHSAH